MIRLFPQRLAAVRFLAISITFVVALILAASFRTSTSSGTNVTGRVSTVAAAPLPGIFYTVTGTVDNTDVVIHGGTGTAGDPFQMSSLRGAVLNANTLITSAVGPATISVPAGTYQLSVNNPNTPAITGTVNFPDLEIGSSTSRTTTIVGTGGMPTIQQTVSGNDVITTGFASDGFTPVAVALTLQNLAITGGSFSGIFTGVDTGSERSNTTLINCNVHDNSDPFGQGGGIFNQTGDLTIQGSTFANNSASQQGGAIFFDLPNSDGSPGTFGSLIITDSTFNNNTASASNNVAGGAIAIFAPNRIENTYSITGSTFTNNQATGTLSAGGGIGSGGTGTLSVHLSRFTGNTATGGGSGVAGQGVSPIDAINNWWGCDGLPGSSGCDSASGTAVSSDPRLDLVLTSAPGCASTTLTADFSKNSAGAAVMPTVLNGLTVQFAVVSGPAGSNVSPASAVISGFMATSSLTATSGGTATVSATLDNGTATTSADIDKSVAVTSNPTDQTVCDGATAIFTATASGNPTPTVQWQVSTNGGGSFSDISGATSPVLSFTATAAQNGNQYRAVFTNTCESTTNTSTTTAATLTVNTAPTISTNPTNQTVCDGASATFTAAAGGSASTVQWQVSTNGGASFSNISGATSTTLTFTASTSQNGNQYRAVFTNSCGSATTTAATLTIEPSTATTTLGDQTVCQGGAASFSTTAGGTGPFHYAWTVDGSSFNGDNSSISVPTGSLSVGTHPVSVTVSGTCGSVTKNATLTVQQNTSATTPADQTVCQGASANFSTTASGTGPFHYAWTVDGSSFNGDNSSISVPTGSLSIGAHPVSVTVSGTCGSATKNATLTVQANTATTKPNDQTVCQGASAGFSTTASGTGPFHYAWTLDGSPFNGDNPSISVPTGSLSVGNHTVAVTTTGTCSSASQSATLTVQPSTTTTDPPDQTVCQGASASFSTTASGTGPFHYAWTLDGSPFNGDNPSISVPTGSLSTGNHTVSVTTTGSCGSASQTATLTVQPGTTTTDPPDQTVCQGASAGFATTAGGTGPFHYAWTLDGSPFNGDNPSISVPTGSLSVGNHTVSVTTTGSCGSASQSATLTVQANTSTTKPNDQTVCQGASASFSTTASGTGPFHYAWTLDGSPFNGDSSSISVPTGSLSVGNHTVSVTTTGTCGSASQSATLTVQPGTTTTDPPDQTVCPGTNANFTTTAGGTGPFHYAWKLDGSPFNGDNASISVPTGSLSTGNHTVSVTTTGSCGSASQTATLTVRQNTSTTDPADQNVCLGGTASFSTTASGTGPFSFVWKKGVTVLHNGDLGGRVTIVSSSSSSTLTISNVQSGDFGTYNIETTGSCNTATQSATLAVNNTPPSITLNGQNIELWPPNHSYHTITVGNLVASASSCDGTVNINSVIIDHVTSDEAENGNGSGNTLNDIVIACNRKSVQLRAEREGGGDGRVYTIYFKVTDGLGHSTTVSAKVTVPHSQSGDGAVDSGPHYTVSSATCP